MVVRLDAGDLKMPSNGSGSKGLDRDVEVSDLQGHSSRRRVGIFSLGILVGVRQSAWSLLPGIIPSLMLE